MRRIFILIFLFSADVWADCSRIVSLAPSITEVIYQLNLENKLVGVTRYCLYPEATQSKSKIGDFFNINYEAVVSLKPSIIFVLSENREQITQLRRLGFEVVVLEHRNMTGILDSITEVGEKCGQKSKALEIVTELRRRVESIRNKVKSLSVKKVLVMIGGGSREGALKNLWVSGNDGYYTELLQIAGGENVYTSASASVPSLSAEGVLKLNPQVIVEVIPDRDVSAEEAQSLVQAWEEFPEIEAVRKKRVHILSGQYVSIPGPRFILLLEELAKRIHS